MYFVMKQVFITCTILFVFAEFDAFLAQRAQEADQLPDINATNSRPRGNRQMQSAEENDNTLFSL